MYYRHTAKCAEEEGAIGRQTERKALIAMAVEERGAGLGRIRMQRVRNASVAGLLSFVKGRREQASELLPLVHKAISLLKRWLLGTHQGGVSHEHPDYYLDEFVFRFNRRSSRSRGNFSTAWCNKRSPWSRRPSARSSPTGGPRPREPNHKILGSPEGKEILMSKQKRYVLSRVSLMLWTGSCLTLSAQTTGAIGGQVSDPTGAAVPNATVEVENVGTGLVRTGVTETLGTYLIPALPLGAYKLSVRATGFKAFSQSGISLQLGQNARVDASTGTGINDRDSGGSG